MLIEKKWFPTFIYAKKNILKCNFTSKQCYKVTSNLVYLNNSHFRMCFENVNFKEIHENQDLQLNMISFIFTVTYEECKIKE